MDIWLSWLLGLVIWIFCIAIIIGLMFLIVNSSNDKLRGHIPNEAFNYSFRPSFISPDAFLIDLHSHTIASDGWMTAEQNIMWHKANGFNAYALTDHNTGKNNEAMLALQAKYPDILLIPGYEWTTERVHLNFIGIKDYEYPVHNLSKGDEDIKFAISKAKELGAMCTGRSYFLDHGSTFTTDRENYPSNSGTACRMGNRWD